MKFLSLFLEGTQTILCPSEFMGSSDPQGTSLVLSRFFTLWMDSWSRASCTALSMGFFPLSASKLLSPSISPLSPACHLLNSGSHWSSWTLSYCSLGRVCLQVVMVATSGPAQSLPARKGWCPVLEHCYFVSVRFCWSNYSSLIQSPVQPAHILCVSVHTACLLPKVNSCPRKCTGKVQRVAAKEIPDWFQDAFKRTMSRHIYGYTDEFRQTFPWDTLKCTCHF